MSLSPELWRVVPLARWEEGDWSWGAPQPPDPADIQLNRRIADQVHTFYILATKGADIAEGGGEVTTTCKDILLYFCKVI